jgi:hypothetical protein
MIHYVEINIIIMKAGHSHVTDRRSGATENARENGTVGDNVTLAVALLVAGTRDREHL